MTTTVHLPDDLLASVDHLARELGMSRNRYIVRALEQAIENEIRWSRRFSDELRTAHSDVEGGKTLQELVEVVKEKRTRKDPPAL